MNARQHQAYAQDKHAQTHQDHTAAAMLRAEQRAVNAHPAANAPLCLAVELAVVMITGVHAHAVPVPLAAAEAAV